MLSQPLPLLEAPLGPSAELPAAVRDLLDGLQRDASLIGDVAACRAAAAMAASALVEAHCAVWMGLHARLGDQSTLLALNEDVVERIAAAAFADAPEDAEERD